MKILAAQYHIPAQAVLQNYMLERLLERISISKYRDKVISHKISTLTICQEWT